MGPAAMAPAGRPIGSAAPTAGFTLVEILVILAVLGLAAGVAVQFARGFGARRQAQRFSEMRAGEIGLLRAEGPG
jgi:type II secretory pathway pseudopilin PulG